jgi:hypothetical protein
VRRGAARRARGGAGARRHLGVLLLMLKEHAEAGQVVRRCLAAAQAKCAHLGAPRLLAPTPRAPAHARRPGGKARGRGAG